MKVTAWASATATIAYVAAQFGWWHAIGAGVFLLCLWVALGVIRNRSWMQATNGHEVSRGSAHQKADAHLTRIAAAIGTEAARDLALEASSILDEMFDAGATASELEKAARALARQFPKQLPARARTTVRAPDVRPVDGRGALHREVAGLEWTIQTSTRSRARLETLLSNLRHVGFEELELYMSADREWGIRVRFEKPVAMHEVIAAAVGTPIRVICPTPRSPGFRPHTAG